MIWIRSGLASDNMSRSLSFFSHFLCLLGYLRKDVTSPSKPQLTRYFHTVELSRKKSTRAPRASSHTELPPGGWTLPWGRETLGHRQRKERRRCPAAPVLRPAETQLLALALFPSQNYSMNLTLAFVIVWGVMNVAFLT